MASPLEKVVSIYPVLTTLTSHLSAVDLLNLALTSQTSRASIMKSTAGFESLLRSCICDGHGLRRRQELSGFYKIDPPGSLDELPLCRNGKHRPNWDEEIEVRVFNIKCNLADTLPCRKCGINICEECRTYARVRDNADSIYYTRRPHLNHLRLWENVMALCPECDAKMEEDLRGKFLNELCDCDRLKRWICHRCAVREDQETEAYCRDHVPDFGDPEWDDAETKSVDEYPNHCKFFCSCGRSVPQEQRMRCTWCKRRHLPEDDWLDELSSDANELVLDTDRDPTYPVWPFTTLDIRIFNLEYPTPYPPLQYSQLIKEQLQNSGSS